MIESSTPEVNSNANIHFSEFCFNDQKHIFLSVKCGEDVDNIERVCQELTEKLSEYGSDADSIFRMTCYVKNEQSKAEIKAILTNFYSPAPIPPCEIVAQPSLEGAEISICAWAVQKECIVRPEDNVAIIQVDNQNQWIMVQQSCPLSDAYENFYQNYNEIENAFVKNDFAPVDIARTWIYIYDIDGMDKDDNNYQGVNHARKEIYNKINFAGRTGSLVDFPASTGIGLQDKAITYSALACNPGMQNKVISIENQSQTPAFEYPEDESKFQPLFSRAIALLDGDKALCSISGTASILEAKSVFIGDAARQTDQTLDNIENLISVSNLQANNINVDNGGLEAALQYVVYIKHVADYGVVREICEKRLPHNIPHFYVHADVCRDDLLVEIEAFTLHKLSK